MCCGNLNWRGEGRQSVETCFTLETSLSLMLARVKLQKSFGKILYIQDGYKVSSLFLVFCVLCPKVAWSSAGSWTGLLALAPRGASSSLLPPWLCCSLAFTGVLITSSATPYIHYPGEETILVWFFFLLQISELNQGDAYQGVPYGVELEREERTGRNKAVTQDGSQKERPLNR